MKYIIVDIDGTVADCSRRQHHVQKSPKDWDAFFADMSGDTMIEATGRLVRMLTTWGWYKTVFCTGRGEEYRNETVEWIDRVVLNGGVMRSWYDTNLLMRPRGDRRDDPTVKPELLVARGIVPGNTAFILEDRNRMVKRWRELGFTCWQVAEGDF